MSSWKIDPATGDYVIEKGKPVSSDSLVYPAFYRTRAPRNKWLHAPNRDWGSDLYSINKKTANTSGIVNTQKKCLQPLLEDGRAISVDVSISNTSLAQRSNVGLEVKITNVAGVTETLNLPPLEG